jgi:hypothetical protein
MNGMNQSNRILSPVLIAIAVTLLACAVPGSVSAQGSAAEDSSSAPAKALDLDKLLSDEAEDDLLTEDKPTAAASADSSEALPSEATPDISAVADKSKQPASGRRGPPPSTGADSAPEFAGPAVIEDGRTVNFAQNLKEYKSPRVAMLLSLLLPGLGQAYARSYIKAAAFGAAEVAAISAAVYFNSKAKSKRNEAYRWADVNFDAGKMDGYETMLRDEFVERGFEEDWAGIVDSAFWADTAKAGKSPYFYESIRYREFTPGWLDNEPGLDLIIRGGDENGVINVPGENGKENRYYQVYNGGADLLFYCVRRVLSIDGEGKPTAVGNDWALGYSDAQAEYNSMMDKSNSYSDAVNYMFYAMLLNHIASAIDAGFTARAHNARLLGADNSVWNRISVEQRHVFTGSAVSPGLALRVKF